MSHSKTIQIALNIKPQEFTAHFTPYFIPFSTWCGRGGVTLTSPGTRLYVRVCLCVCVGPWV